MLPPRSGSRARRPRAERASGRQRMAGRRGAPRRALRRRARWLPVPVGGSRECRHPHRPRGPASAVRARTGIAIRRDDGHGLRRLRCEQGTGVGRLARQTGFHRAQRIGHGGREIGEGEGCKEPQQEAYRPCGASHACAGRLRVHLTFGCSRRWPNFSLHFPAKSIRGMRLSASRLSRRTVQRGMMTAGGRGFRTAANRSAPVFLSRQARRPPHRRGTPA